MMFLLAAVPLASAEPAKVVLPPGAAHVSRAVKDVTQFDVAMTPTAVDRFYRAAFAKEGWTPGDSVTYGTTIVLDLRRKPKGMARVTITPKGNNLTHVTLGITE